MYEFEPKHMQLVVAENNESPVQIAAGQDQAKTEFDVKSQSKRHWTPTTLRSQTPKCSSVHGKWAIRSWVAI